MAVLAGGIDVPYPSGHSALLHRIGKDGLVVSEYPPGVRPARYRFLTRNRLVAALGGATVVVEAGLRSGAANTAAWAESLGRPVCAVPGPVTSSASAGCHVLLRNRCPPGHPGRRDRRIGRPHRRTRATNPVDPARHSTGSPTGELWVYDALPSRGARTVDQVAVATGPTAHAGAGPAGHPWSWPGSWCAWMAGGNSPGDSGRQW